MRFQGKVVVVTGASRGIGRAIALRFGGEGALVCVNYHRNTEAAERTVRDIQGAGGGAFALKADVGDVNQIIAFFDALDVKLQELRGDRGVDILVNNAGISGGGPLAATTEADFDRIFATNVKGPFFILKQALPRLRPGGRVINVSSGLSRRPMGRAVAYCMTKAAINNLTEAMAEELRLRGITINTLSPGLTATDLNAEFRAIPHAEETFAGITALKRIGKAEDIADAALLAASPEAGWITGAYLDASGGLGLVMPSIGRPQ